MRSHDLSARTSRGFTSSRRLLWDRVPCQRRLLVGLAMVLAFTGSSPAQVRNIARVAYGFTSDQAGGIAEAAIDSSSGRILRQSIVFQSDECRRPAKLRRSRDGRHLAVTNLQKRGAQLFLARRAKADTPKADDVQTFKLRSLPDELKFSDGQLLVSCEEDALVAIPFDAEHPESSRIRFDEILDPPGNGPQDIQIVAEDQLAVISCQKDGKGGEKKGNRILLLKLPTLELVADLPLPREHPELHLADDSSESGPGPEIVYVSRDSDTLVTTLDLYGAIGMMRWSAAKEGRVEDWTCLSASPDRTWGTAFPDRASPLRFAGNDYFLVHNAGSEGGSTVVDLRNRRVVWQRATPPGLEQSAYFPKLRLAFTVCSGKVKERSADDIQKSLAPQMRLFVFDFRSSRAVREASVETVALEMYTARIHAVSQDPPLLLIAAGSSPERADMLITFDPVTRSVRDRQEALGAISQFER